MLTNCVAYRDGKRLAEIQPSKFDRHPLAVEDAQVGHQRRKIEDYGAMAAIDVCVFVRLRKAKWL